MQLSLLYLVVDLLHHFAEEYGINVVVDAHICRGTSEDLDGKIVVRISFGSPMSSYNLILIQIIVPVYS